MIYGRYNYNTVHSAFSEWFSKILFSAFIGIDEQLHCSQRTLKIHSKMVFVLLLYIKEIDINLLKIYFISYRAMYL